MSQLRSNSITPSFGGMQTPSGHTPQHIEDFLRDVADRLERIAPGVQITNAIRARELQELAHECRVKEGM